MPHFMVLKNISGLSVKKVIMGNSEKIRNAITEMKKISLIFFNFE
jgi:hypothetical protein